MNKKNLIILTISIIIFLGALAVFIYANSLNKKEETEKKVEPTIIKSDVSESTFIYDLDGKKINLDDFSNKPMVVFLWKSDDSNSYTIINLLTKYYEEYKNKINFLAINVNEPDIDINLVENLKAANFSIPIYLDTDLKLEEKYNSEKLPHILFIEEDGNIGKEIYETIDEDVFTANLDLLIHNY